MAVKFTILSMVDPYQNIVPKFTRVNNFISEPVINSEAVNLIWKNNN